MIENPILLELPTKLVGARVVVRPFVPGDGVALFEAIDESREHITPWLPFGPSHQSPADSETFVRKAYAKWILREDLPLAIFDRSEARLLGATGVHRIDWTVRSYEIGYWIRASEEGRGLVTEAVELVVRMIEDHLEPARVYIRCAKGNVRSAAIPVRLGFVEEGLIRSSIRDTDGTVHDARWFVRVYEPAEK